MKISVLTLLFLFVTYLDLVQLSSQSDLPLQRQKKPSKKKDQSSSNDPTQPAGQNFWESGSHSERPPVTSSDWIYGSIDTRNPPVTFLKRPYGYRSTQRESSTKSRQSQESTQPASSTIFRQSQDDSANPPGSSPRPQYGQQPTQPASSTIFRQSQDDSVNPSGSSLNPQYGQRPTQPASPRISRQSQDNSVNPPGSSLEPQYGRHDSVNPPGSPLRPQYGQRSTQPASPEISRQSQDDRVNPPGSPLQPQAGRQSSSPFGHPTVFPQQPIPGMEQRGPLPMPHPAVEPMHPLPSPRVHQGQGSIPTTFPKVPQQSQVGAVGHRPFYPGYLEVQMEDKSVYLGKLELGGKNFLVQWMQHGEADSVNEYKAYIRSGNGYNFHAQLKIEIDIKPGHMPRFHCPTSATLYHGKNRYTASNFKRYDINRDHRWTEGEFPPANQIYVVRAGGPVYGSPINGPFYVLPN